LVIRRSKTFTNFRGLIFLVIPTKQSLFLTTNLSRAKESGD
jgi:hypothetical protein